LSEIYRKSITITTREIRSAEVARLLGISQRQARNLLRAWTAAGWLEVANPSNRGRRYRLRQTEP